MFRSLPLVCLLLTALLSGRCGDRVAAAEARPLPSQPPTAPPRPAFQWHFAGARRLAEETNAPLLQKSVNATNSEPVAALLATNLVRKIVSFRSGETNPLPAEIATLVPQVRQFLAAESVGEIQSRTQWAFAIRIESPDTGAWSNGLASVASQPVQLESTQGWLLAGTGASGLARAHELIHTPMPVSLFSGTFDAAKWPAGIWPKWLFSPARGEFSILATNDNLRTTLRLKFPATLDLHLAPWKFPQVVRDPLVSFSAARGIHPLIENASWFGSLQLSNAPDQMFVWMQPGSPFRLFYSLPAESPNQTVDTLADRLRPLFVPTNGLPRVMGSIKHLVEKHTLWISLSGGPPITPFLLPIDTTNGGWVFGGFSPGFPSTNPPPDALVAQLQRTNLVAYSWENTEETVGHWRQLLQTLDVFTLGGLIQAKSPANAWLAALPLEDRNASTEVLQTGPADLELNRKSALGFTGFELMQWARWLDAPFAVRPRGMAPRPSLLPLP